MACPSALSPSMPSSTPSQPSSPYATPSPPNPDRTSAVESPTFQEDLPAFFAPKSSRLVFRPLARIPHSSCEPLDVHSVFGRRSRSSPRPAGHATRPALSRRSSQLASPLGKRLLRPYS